MDASPNRPHEPRNTRFAITTRRPVAILMVVMAVCVFGLVSYKRLALTLMPNISYPALTVRTEYPGTAPEEVESIISKPLEQELSVVQNLVNISSISKAGESDIIMEFAWNTDMNTITQEIRERIDRVRLPDDAQRPLLLHYDPSLDPIMRIGLSGPQSLYDLRYLADNDLKRSLEAVKGVAAIKVKGGLEEEFHVSLDEKKMAVLGLDISQINNRLAQGNVNLPGGNLREGQTEYLIRTLNEFHSLSDIGSLIVARQNGADIHLRDIATITRSYKDRQVITRVNGQESIEIEVYKEADANIVDVARRVRDRIFGTPQQQAFLANLKKEQNQSKTSKKDKRSFRERRRAEAAQALAKLSMTNFLEHDLPQGAHLEVLSDQSRFIENSINEVKSNAIMGGLLSIIVLYLFLRNAVHTAIIGVTIPVSVIATFAPMYLFGVSLNIISLGGLALGVGMLVDNSIVVLESIFRCREDGDDIVTAAVRGTGEVGGAVIASTLTTVAVFFPIVFVEGVASQVFGDMSLTVVFSLLASLVVALFFIPMLASRQLPQGTDSSIGRMKSSPFLQIPSPSEGRNRFFANFLHAPRVILLFLGRILLAVATTLLALIKTAASVLFPILWILLVWWNRRLVERYAAWCAHGGLGNVVPADSVWPGILAFSGPESFMAASSNLGKWIRRGSAAGNIARLIPALVAFIFLLAKLGFETAVRLIGGLIQLAGFSLVLAFLIVVRLAILVIQPIIGPALGAFGRAYDATENFYPRIISWALHNRAKVVIIALTSFLVCWFVFVPRIGRDLIPQVHQGEFNLDLTLPVGTPLDRTAGVAHLVESVAEKQPEVDRVATTVGSDQSATSSAEEGENTARITVKLKDGWTASEEDRVIDRIRSQLVNIPETKVEVSYPSLFSFKSPIEVDIQGYNLDTLRRLSRAASAEMKKIPGLVDVHSTLQAGNPELQIKYNRARLAELGLNLRTVAELVRNKVQGQVPTEFRRKDQQIDILTRLQSSDRIGLDDLKRLIVNPGASVPVPLSAVAHISVNEGPSEIRRIDQQRAAVITANVKGADLSTVSNRIVQALENVTFPPGFSYRIGGQNEEMKTSLNSMVLALGLALFLVYIVMASQFESLIHPFIIMFTVPLAIIGVSIVLWAFNIPLSILVFIGLIMLAGIVVNNAIVLVDYINSLRARGMPRMKAIMEAGRLRLRPILMTTTTTVLGLLPMALGFGDGAEIRQPMAITVIVGLISSTALTLIVIPTVYDLVDRKP